MPHSSIQLSKSRPNKAAHQIPFACTDHISFALAQPRLIIPKVPFSIMWYFLARQVALNSSILLLNLGLFLLGVVLILGAVFIGGFAGAWTFLYPLPAQSGGAWEAHAAAIYMVGVLLVGVGFLLLHLDTGWAILSRYGSLTKALGWPQMFGTSIDDAPPPVIFRPLAAVMPAFSTVMSP